jgi:hypothetical protein
MLRKRRYRYRSEFALVAAEVLELRDLLSSATAAVHGATQHAELLASNGPEGKLAPQAFHSAVQIKFTVAGGIGETFPGQFSLSKVTLVDGSKVTAHFSVSNAQTGNEGSVKGTFVGKISTFGHVNAGTQVQITPTGGGVVIHTKTAGKSVTFKTAPNGTPIVLLLNNGNFVDMGEDTVYLPGAPPDLAGKTLETFITL